MEREKQIMTEEEIREYFKQKGITVESVEFSIYAHISFSFAVMVMLRRLQEVAQDMGDPNPGIAGSFDGGFKLIINIKNNPLKK